MSTFGGDLTKHSQDCGAAGERSRGLLGCAPVAFAACDQRLGRVSSQARLRSRNVDHSGPVAYAHPPPARACLSAREGRSYETTDVVCDLARTTCRCARKVSTLDQAAPLQGCDLPPEFATLRHLVLARIEGRPAWTGTPVPLPSICLGGDERDNCALLDRLTLHVHILEMNGKSHRLGQSRARRAKPTP